MLSLKIDGQPVDLPNDFSVTMNLKSPAFNEVGSYSYPFKIPYSPRNAFIFNFRNRVQNQTDPYITYNGVFSWNGITLFNGTVKMKLFNNFTFEGSIYEGNGDFNYQRKNATLQDVDYGVLEFSSESTRLGYMNSCIDKYYPDCNICFPQILNKSYFDELPENTGLHYCNIYINSFLQSVFSGGSERTILVPMLYLRYVLKKIFLYIGYSVDDRFFSSGPEFNKLSIFNLVDCNNGDHGFFPYDVTKIFLNYHLPRLSLNEFFSGLETMFNIRFFVNTFKREVVVVSLDSIIKSTDYFDFSKNISLIETEISDQITGYNLSMTMDTDDELYEIRKEYDESVIDRLKENVKSVSDLNPWPSDNIMDMRYVLDADRYYILWSNKQWIPWVSDLTLYFNYRYRSNQQSIETKFSTLLNNNASDDAVVGNKREDWENVTGKLFFNDYVSSSPVRMRALPLTTNNSLYYGGTNGLFNKYFKTWFDFRMSTKLVKITKLMTFKEILDLDFSKKYYINGVMYLISSIRVTIKRDRIMPAVIECYPCQ